MVKDFFPVRIGNKTKISAFISLRTVLEHLTTAMKQEKKKRYTDWEEIILFLFAEGLILYMEYSKGSSKQNKNKNKQVNFARLQKKIKILIMNM